MACRYREELVGKRFISVRSPQKLKIQKISEWEWRSGIVRAVSIRDTSSLDLSVLIEFDDIDWSRREWVRVHDIFQLFLVEHTLVWAERPDPDKPKHSLSWPGLSFRAVVDKAGLAGCKRKPVEFLVDRFLGLVEEKEIQIFKEGNENNHPTAVARRAVHDGLKEWLDYQDGQKILLTTPTVLVGYRLEVYRAEGTTQWYTAVIQSYNHSTKSLSVVDDTVLEEHNEDPTLIQMHLIDDGVVDSILRGVEIGGIAPRRRPRAVKENNPQSNTTRVNSSGNLTLTSARATVSKKARTPQQASAACTVSSVVVTPSLPASPALPADRQDNKTQGIEKPSVKQQKTQHSKERKRRSDTYTPSVTEPTNIKKKIRTDDTATSKVKVQAVASKAESDITRVSEVESTPPVRVSPRTTPSKERSRPQRSRERDKDTGTNIPIVTNSEPVVSVTNIENTNSDSNSYKIKIRSRQKKEDKVDSPSKKVESPRNLPESPRGSPRRRSLSRTPVQTEAESVIKSISGSKRKDKKNTTEKSEKKVSNTSAKPETSELKADTDVKNSIVKASIDSTCSLSSNEKDKDEETVVDKNIDIVEQKVQEIKSAFKKKEKESGSTKSAETKEKKLQKICTKKETTGKRQYNKKKDNETAQGAAGALKICVDAEKASCTSDTSINESGDNMHYIKKKQSILAGGLSSGIPQNSGIPSSSIDLNQSVTDQITRAEKLTAVPSEEKAGSSSSSLASPVLDTFAQRDAECPPSSRDKLSGSNSSGFHNTNLSLSDERSQSRNSDSRCSSGFSGDEGKRPASRIDEIKSVKNSPASSPLIVDKSEPVQIYRDPELMSKNPVRSNVPNMHNSHKSYPQVHNPIPTQASRPASVGMPASTPLSSGLERSARAPVIPSVAYPSPLPMGASALPGASLSNLLPPGLHQLDPATLAIHQQIHAAQQQQVAAVLAQQYNSLSMSYPPRGTLSKPQLELLWQQKYPSLPVPPPWLLAKQHDELVGGVRMIHEQEQMERERMERLERDRDLRERERKERERRERERMEKDRIDRERREREKIEQERAERERIEREKEKERAEREHRERIERERNRILKETAVDSQAAVDKHFSESLRLASQRNWKKVGNHHQAVNMQDGYHYHANANYRSKYMAAQTGMWPQPSITLGTGKPKMEAKHQSKMGEIKPEEKINQEHLMETDFKFAELMRKQQQAHQHQQQKQQQAHQQQAHQHQKAHQQQAHQHQQQKQQHQDEMMIHKELMSQQEEFIKQQQRHQRRLAADHKEVKVEHGRDIKPNMYAGYPGKHEHPATSAPSSIKQEMGTASFSLYGYQPEKYSFISADKLHSYEQDKIKCEKGMIGRSQSPRKKDISVPPPLIKDLDTKSHSSVIVKNNRDGILKSSSPHGSSHYASHMSQHQQPKPAHTPERPHSSNSSPGGAHGMSPAMAHQQMHMAAMRAADAHQTSTRSQSPLNIASAQKPSSAVMQPMDYTCSPNMNKMRASPGSRASPHGVAATSPAIAQPPVSLPQSSNYTYGLIQQGFVPNPIYSNNSKNPDSQRTVSVTGTAQVPRAAHSPPSFNSQQQQISAMGTKRKGQKDANVRKRQKAGETGNNNPLNLCVPCTTPQIVTNPSPYTTSSSSIPSTAMCTTQSNTSASFSQPVVNNRLSGLTGFMDSFKSFVENTVQNAFKEDPETGKMKKPTPEQLKEMKELQQQHIKEQLAHKTQPYKPKTSLERSCTPVTSQQEASATPDQPSNLSNSGSNSAMSYTDSINRVANGQIDTDSDTLSAPSPPPHLKQENNITNPSPNKTAKHPNLKKAWLQRHSDEDKQECKPAVEALVAPALPGPTPVSCPNVVTDTANPSKPNCPPPPGSEQEKEEQVKTRFVNSSYVSPRSASGSKSPISAVQQQNVVSNGTGEPEKDESTTSASETEVQTSDSIDSRKRTKTKKEKVTPPTAKKIKTEPPTAINAEPTTVKTEPTENANSPINSNTTNQTTTNKKKNATKRNKDGKVKPSEDNISEEQIKKIVENCKESATTGATTAAVKVEAPEPIASKPAVTKPTEEAYDSKFDFDDEDGEQSRNSTETMDCDAGTPDQRSELESSRKSDGKDNSTKKEKKKHKDGSIKKEKKIKKERAVKKDIEFDDEVETQEIGDSVYTAPSPQFKDTEVKVQTSQTFSKPLVRVTEAELKKSCEPFLQDGSCSEVTPKLMKCRECKMTPTQRGKTVPNIFCRFYAFRRLNYSQRGFVTINGFSELSDAEQDDIDPWIPKFPIIEPKIDVETARFIIGRVGDKFCELVQQERQAQICAGDTAKIAWKRAVTGVREMCDVCDTTLFNMHWVCRKCGFVVCLDCYTVKAENGSQDEDSEDSETDSVDLDVAQRKWLTCSANRQPHNVQKLMLTQIIPADALWEVGRMVHEVREKWAISQTCPCSPKMNSKKNGIKSDLVYEAMKHYSPKKKLVNGIGSEDDKPKTKNGNIKVYNPDNSSPLSLLADVASMDSEKTRERSESPLLSKKKEGKNGKSYNPITEPVSPGSSEKKMPQSCSTLRELLTKTAGGKKKNSSESSKKKSKNSNSLNDIIQKVVEKQVPKDGPAGGSEQPAGSSGSGALNEPKKLLHYTPRGTGHQLVRETPIVAHNLTETSVLYPDVPHSWLCDGRLLRLHDSRHRGNLKIFMEQWKHGQPVLVSGVDKSVNQNLWKPAYFSQHFGNLENDLINCRTSCVVVGHPMKHFWDGFGCVEERLIDEDNLPMLLKLKDWPPGDDFSDVLPQQFHDLMQALPLPEYTRRDGRLNLVSRLPDFLVKPDLGPKMYIAYGSAQYPKEGTTNLHLDVSDAANLMVYVGYLEQEERGHIEKDQDAFKAMEMARCDPITKRRIREVRETPGALWHIFDAVDADKIRDFLNMVGKERGEKIEQNHDPIHDQSWYLDELLRDRLCKEYGVHCYTILQCLGDAIFIPAGAPHQVRNLNNCIKVAEDFVSPENIHHCFQLTEEFRDLSVGHSNHEDKLQIKNIIYHAMKDSTAVLNDADPDEFED